MAKAAIQCVRVVKRFGAVHAVDGVSFSLAKGRILALLGPSGCGKTTTLRLLAGFERPDAGIVEIGGRVVVNSGLFVPPEKRRVGMVFQDYALFPHMSLEANVAYGLGREPGRRARVARMLELVGLAGLENRMPHELSGGQQQRVALARALAPGPEVVLLDEPFSNLDATLRVRVRAEVREILKAAGATAVFVTHDQEEALSLADDVALMLQGRIVQMAGPEELYQRPATKAAADFLGDADFLRGNARDGVIDCELGRLRCRDAVSGPTDVMLRPESIALASDPSSSHRVASREFFGHDQLITVRLASGARLRARMSPRAAFRPGDPVRIEVRDEVVAYAA